MKERIKYVRRWIAYVVTSDEWPHRWQDRLFRGHVNIGPITIWGANAMHWAINIRAGSEYWCFHPRTRTFGGKWPAYFYVSRDGTPYKARLAWGDTE